MCTEELAAFISKCLQKDPAKRIEIKNMLDDPWFSFSDDELEDKLDTIN
eukprot:CAMPEP_0176366858 /NCGR_PEP_ID=MMETSP0126-20121128/21474_1 /TAXON_ID=141414 ORGANISM="Strombidinopsis acuminatum, Strain SPMC142" /NCGR_SAMPLE_ID=MMETSP0126 /ASSEMBLY_ACC=CAM_ASM_000229 /LENGTH=48 /DNA_ID= /DNA_START= /DNA_END= /DNA_ORIENTATION=